MATTQKGVPGGTFVQTYKTTAKVTAVDPSSRHVTLVSPDGNVTVFKAGPEVVNFDQIHGGDEVNATLTRQLVVFMATEAPPPSASASTTVALAPVGAKPAGLVADTVQVTARVIAIDPKHHEATLQFPDGSTSKVQVRKDVDLTQRKVGEQVVIRLTEALALSVEKP
jgi:hypothetical protein